MSKYMNAYNAFAYFYFRNWGYYFSGSLVVH